MGLLQINRFSIQYKSLMMNELEKRQNLILPNSTFVVVWSLFSALVIFIYFGTTIFQIAFHEQINQIFNKSYLSLVVLLFFLTDTLIYVNIAIIINGKLVRNRHSNFKNYFSSSLFVTDLIVVLTMLVRICLGLINAEQYETALSILDLVVILKFYNISKYEKMLKFYYFNQWSLLIFQFTKHVILLAFLCHVVACVFFKIDIMMIQAGWYSNDQYWLFNSSAMPLLYYQSKSQQYLYSFYFAIVTLSTIAYGDITPLNPTQVSFVILILAFLLMFYIYIFSQIYQVVNWFNRKRIQTQQNKYKIASFLKKYNISMQLSCRIISQYQFREKQNNRADKSIFIDDISTKLAKSYNSLPFTNYGLQQDCNFVPYFIKVVQIQSSLFYETLQQQFVTPDKQFSCIEIHTMRNQYQLKDGSTIQRSMYFVPANTIINRILQYGRSHIRQLAQQNSWLGLNNFLTSQHDPNQSWKSQTSLRLIKLKYSNFLQIIKNNYKAYQRLMQQTHRATFNIQFEQDKNKCLLCYQGFHISKYCTQYRPQIKRKDKLRLLRSLTLLLQKQKLKIRVRQQFKRLNRVSNKKTNIVPLKKSPIQIGIQTDLLQFCDQFLQHRAAPQEMVIDWNYYMPYYNISNHQNIVGVLQNYLKDAFLKKHH